MIHKRGFARLIAICALAGSVLLVLAACGASTSGGYSGTPTPASGGSGSSGGGSTISVTEKEFSITPSTATAPAGKITFEIKNTGAVAHDIGVDINGTVKASPLVQPGKSATWSVTIDTPGTYQFFCTVPGHKEAGMKGTLTVGASTSASSGSSTASSASSNSGSSGGATSISVTEKEFSITPSTVTAPAGKITFEIKNTGAVAHDIGVDINGTVKASPLVQPGKSETWSVTIDTPGTYQFFCTVPGHKEAGMKGTLTIN